MATGGIDYPQMVQAALRGVVRQALAQVAEDGLPGGHHFYLTFRTDHPGVVVPRSLRERYPETLTVVIQHQFWGLTVEEDSFSVTLRFGGARHEITVPFPALVSFVDPAAEFGLEFPGSQAAPGGSGEARVAGEGEAVAEPGGGRGAPPGEAGPDGGKVVSLDKFRKR